MNRLSTTNFYNHFNNYTNSKRDLDEKLEKKLLQRYILCHSSNKNQEDNTLICPKAVYKFYDFVENNVQDEKSEIINMHHMGLN